MFNWSGNFRVIILLFFATNCYSQSIEQAPVSTVFRANMLNPGLSYELPVGLHQTAVLFGGVFFIIAGILAIRLNEPVSNELNDLSSSVTE